MANEVDDMFEDAPTAPTTKYPSMKQLANGDVKVNVVYAKGDKDKEVIKDTTGRLCIFRPATVAKSVPDNKNPGQMKNQMEVDVVLLTGPPITEVLDKDDEVTGELDPPKVPGDVLARMFVSQTVLVGQLSKLGEKAGTGPVGKMSVGRLVLLPPRKGSSNKPWAIGTATDPKQKAADLKLAKTWVESKASSLFD